MTARAVRTAGPFEPLADRTTPAAVARADSRRGAVRLWGALAVLTGVAAAWIVAAGMRVGSAGLLGETGAIALLGTIAVVYARTGRSLPIARAAEASAQLIATGVVMEVLSYLATRVAGPLRDAALARADAALGFDWDAWTRGAHAHPAVALVLAAAYASMVPQLAAAALYLGLRRQPDLLLGTMVVSGAVTIALSGLVPALGHLPHAPHVPDFLALRAHTMRTIDLARLQGLISFPSYHAALAVVLIVALWSDRVLRWAVLALDAVMLLATISEGGHYLIDVVAGVGIALASALVARRAFAGATRA